MKVTLWPTNIVHVIWSLCLLTTIYLVYCQSFLIQMSLHTIMLNCLAPSRFVSASLSSLPTSLVMTFFRFSPLMTCPKNVECLFLMRVTSSQVTLIRKRQSTFKLRGPVCTMRARTILQPLKIYRSRLSFQHMFLYHHNTVVLEKCLGIL